MKTLASNSFNIILVMALTGLLSGTAMVGIYLGTKDKIEINRQLALEKAIKIILPGTYKIQKYQYQSGGLQKVNMSQKAAEINSQVYEGLGEGGDIIGYAIPAIGPGFMDDISLIYGYNGRDKKIIGMAVLESRETPGLGDKIIFDTDFHKNFKQLEVEPEIVAVKHGTKSKNNEIDCISGATISSKAVGKILQTSMEIWKNRLAKK